MNTLRTRLRFVVLALALASSVGLSVGTVAACNFPQRDCHGTCIGPDDLCILEPVPGGVTSIPATATAGLGAFFYYINNGVWQWAFGMGVAIAVLNGTVGGLQIVLSNGDSGKIDAGKTRFFWSGVGLIVLLLTGVILQFINPIGFQNV